MALLTFPLLSPAQILSEFPQVITNKNFRLDETQRQRILKLLDDVETDNRPRTIVVLNPLDFKQMRLNAAGRARLPGAKASGGAFTILDGRRTFLSSEVLNKSDEELENVLIHEVVHIMRDRRKAAQDEALVVEDALKMLLERRKARARKKEKQQ